MSLINHFFALPAVVFILLLALADRVRGSGWFRFNHGIGMLVMNVAAIGLLHPHGWQIAYLLIVPAVGYAPALNPELGRAFDSKSFTFNLVIRGVIWGLPFALINPLYVIPFTVAFIVTPFIFGPLQRKWPAHDCWAWMEATRGLLSGTGLYWLHLFTI